MTTFHATVVVSPIKVSPLGGEVMNKCGCNKLFEVIFNVHNSQNMAI
jgi:hypothetical protein